MNTEFSVFTVCTLLWDFTMQSQRKLYLNLIATSRWYFTCYIKYSFSPLKIFNHINYTQYSEYSMNSMGIVWTVWICIIDLSQIISRWLPANKCKYFHIDTHTHLHWELLGTAHIDINASYILLSAFSRKRYIPWAWRTTATCRNMKLLNLHKLGHLHSTLGIGSALHSSSEHAGMVQGGINFWSDPPLPAEKPLYFARLCKYGTQPFHQAGQSPPCQGQLPGKKKYLHPQA